MYIKESQRSKNIQCNIFQELSMQKQQLIEGGKKVFDFSIGTPDFAPSKYIVDAFKSACDNPENFKYALHDLPELIDAVKYHYNKRFGVKLTDKQIISAQGSQDIISHIALSICDVDDVILVPDPGYPSFSTVTKLMGVNIYKYPLYEKDNFILNLKNIPDEVADKAKFIIICYPSNPTGSVPEDSFYDELILWAKNHDIIIIHDSAYIDITFFEKDRKSFLSYKGANEVGVELYSLSKTYNLTGARIAFMVGNEDIVQSFKKVKSQIDYGIFLPVQYAAIAALTCPQHDVYTQCAIYSERRCILCSELSKIGWYVPLSAGGIFVFAHIPKTFKMNSEQFAQKLMKQTGIIVVPGIAFGEMGEGYVRFSVVLDKNIIKQAISVLEHSEFWRAKDD